MSNITNDAVFQLVKDWFNQIIALKEIMIPGKEPEFEQVACSIVQSIVNQHIEEIRELPMAIAQCCQTYDPESLDVLQGNIECIFKLKTKYQWSNDVVRVMTLFSNYIQIEHIHSITLAKSINALNTTITAGIQKRFVSKTIEIKEIIDQTKKEVINSNKEDIRSLDIHSVSVLGIFTAFTIAFSGSLTLLSSALDNVQGITTSASFILFAACCLIGIVILDAIYFILYAISFFLEKRVVGNEILIRVLNIVLLAFFVFFVGLYYLYVFEPSRMFLKQLITSMIVFLSKHLCLVGIIFVIIIALFGIGMSIRHLLQKNKNTSQNH